MRKTTLPASAKATEASKDDLSQTLAKRVGLEEFLIDFFAGLVPGLAFLAGAGIALLGPLAVFGAAVRQQILLEQVPLASFLQDFAGAVSSTKDTPTALWIAATVAGVLLAYVTGLFIYRLDPDRPDRQSYIRLARTLAKKKDGKPPEYRLACQREEDCHYPYPDLDKYLSARRLHHLLPFVTSRDLAAGDEQRFNSKSHLMILKSRLRFLYPERVGSLIRIESHIRLNASMWYVAHYLERIAWCSLLVVAAAMCLPFATTLGGTDDWRDSIRYSLVAAYPILVLAFARLCRIAVERSLHYQRVRELIHIYEAAYVAFRGQYWHICPPFSAKAFSADA